MKQLLALSKAKQEGHEPTAPIKKKKSAKASFNTKISPLSSQEQFYIMQSNSASENNTDRSIKNNKQSSKQASHSQIDQPPEQQIVAYAQIIGIKLPQQSDLLYLARDGLMAELPEDWDFQENDDGEIVYVNQLTNERSLQHPLDQYFRDKVVIERKKKQQFEAALSQNTQSKLTSLKQATKTNFVSSIYGTQQKKGKPQNKILNDIIAKNVNEGKLVKNSLYDQSDQQSNKSQEIGVEDDEPTSTFFNRTKSSKNLKDQIESRNVKSTDQSNLPTKPAYKQPPSLQPLDVQSIGVEKKQKARLSNSSNQNRKKLGNLQSSQLATNNQKYFNKVKQLGYRKKDIRQIENRKEQISNELYRQFEQKRKIIDQQQAVKLKNLKDAQHFMDQHTLLEILQQMQSQNQHHILKYILSRPTSSLFQLKDQYSRNKKEIQTKVMKQYSDKINKIKEETRKEGSNRRKLKSRTNQLDGLFAQISTCSKQLKEHSNNQPKYFSEFQHNSRATLEIENDKLILQLQNRMREIGTDMLGKIKYRNETAEKQGIYEDQLYDRYAAQIDSLVATAEEKINQHQYKQKYCIGQPPIKIAQIQKQMQSERVDSYRLLEELAKIKVQLQELKDEQHISSNSGGITDRQSKLVDLLQGYQSKPNSARSK